MGESRFVPPATVLERRSAIAKRPDAAKLSDA
jgi:hypothetical protein